MVVGRGAAPYGCSCGLFCTGGCVVVVVSGLCCVLLSGVAGAGESFSVVDGSLGVGLPGTHRWISGHGIAGRLGPGRTVGVVVRVVVVVELVADELSGAGVADTQD